MNVTIRNLDQKLYRKLRARAVKEGRPIGAVLTDAMREYMAMHPEFKQRDGPKRSIFDLPPFDFGPGNERLSERVDEFLYGEDE